MSSAATELDAAARRRLDAQVAEVRADPARVRVLLPAAARTVARDAHAAAPTDVAHVPVQDAVRGELLAALAEVLAGDPDRHASELADLYRFGDADEKRAVVRSLVSSGTGAATVGLLQDALRTNDVRLVAAAMGPHGAAVLDDAAWRQGVLKCLFVGVPLAVVADLPRRVDAELVRMVGSFADERRLAGREVPADVDLVLATASRTAPEQPEQPEQEA